MGKYKKDHEGVQRATRSVPICLKGDLVADWEAADRELKRAQEELRSSDSKESDVGDLVDRVRALEAEMLKHTETWVVRAMPRHKFRALVAAHPPRRADGSENELVVEDVRLGLNRVTFFPQLIRASVVTPELDADDWDWLLGHSEEDVARLTADGKADRIEEGVLTDRQFGDLEDAAWFVNRGEVDAPFSHAASLATRDSGDE